jgi:hypothetical protein
MNCRGVDSSATFRVTYIAILTAGNDRDHTRSLVWSTDQTLAESEINTAVVVLEFDMNLRAIQNDNNDIEVEGRVISFSLSAWYASAGTSIIPPSATRSWSWYLGRRDPIHPAEMSNTNNASFGTFPSRKYCAFHCLLLFFCVPRIIVGTLNSRNSAATQAEA